MRIIIYAAGVSRRLKSLAVNGLKGLLELNGKKIIEYQLDWITRQPITEVVIVLGLEHELYREVLGNEYNGVPIQYVYNPDYKDKGNMLSLWHARQFCDTDILFTTSDLICHYHDIDLFVKSQLKNKILIDNKTSSLFEDPDPVKACIEKGRITRLRKKKEQLDHVDGLAVGLYQFSKQGVAKIITTIDENISQGNDDLSLYYAIDAVLDKVEVKPVFVEKANWFDVDTPTDFEQASDFFSSSF